MEISLSSELRRFVAKQVEQGHYPNQEAVLRAALQWFKAKQGLLASIQADPGRSPWAILSGSDGADIEALAFLVLMEAAKGADEDLKSIMAHVKAINNVK